MNTNLATLSPVAVDTLYLDRLARLDAASREESLVGGSLVSYFGKTVWVRSGRRPVAVHVHADAVVPPGVGTFSTPVASLSDVGLKLLTPGEVVEAVAAGHSKAAGLASTVARYEAAVSALTDARLAVEEVNEEYQSRPWSRYWLVTSSDGHVHRSRHCGTCNRRGVPTGFALVPYLSGQTAADAVADLGPALCSVCFPEAPVESREQSTIPARLALALRERGSEAFKAARAEAAAKAAKTAADRCPGSGERVQTDRHGYARCPSCGWSCRSTTGKVASHRRPRFYAVQSTGGSDKFWDGCSWGPSTRKAAFDSREAAEAVSGATGVRRE